MRFYLATFLCLVVTNICIGQADCLISVANEPSKKTSVRQPLVVTQDATLAQWDLSTTNTAELTLPAGELSSVLKFNNFQNLLPQGSIPTGLQVQVFGSAEGGYVRDAVVQFETGDQQLSEDHSNLLTNGFNWQEGINYWKYGHRLNDWNLDLSPEMLNSPDFTLNVQLENEGNSEAKVVISSIHLLVTYVPNYTVCDDHQCVIMYVANPIANYQYSWQTPVGFVNLDNDESDAIYSLGVGDAPLGEFEVCVEVSNFNTLVETCCRTFQFSDCQLGSIGDSVFEDSNVNGVQDDGELGIGMVSVQLLDEHGILVAQTTTDVDGRYRFTDIEPGNYRVVLVDLDGYFPSYLTSLSDLYSGYSSDIFGLAYSQNRDDIDFGLYNFRTLSGTIWNDTNCDGSFAQGEATIAGLVVRLYKVNGELMATTTAGTQGEFSFGQLLPYQFYITVSGFNPIALQPTLLGQADNPNILQLVNGVAQTVVFDLSQTQNVYLGFKNLLYTLDVQLWEDSNCDGSYSDTEPGFNNTLVNLIDINGQILNSGVVSSTGQIQFDLLPYGQYQIELPSLDPAYTATIIPTQAINSNALQFSNGVFNLFETILLDQDKTLYLGVKKKTGEVSGVVWADLDGDGIQDEAEVRFGDVMVQLFRCDGEWVAASTTDSQGNYSFTDVEPGSYYVMFGGVIDYIYTISTGQPDYVNSDVTAANGVGSTDCAELPGGGQLEFDAGLTQYGSIGDRVWVDTNANGIQDINEEGMNGMVIMLFDEAGGMVDATITEDSPMSGRPGYYRFTSVFPGNYYIMVELMAASSFTQPLIGNSLDDSNITGAFGAGTSDLIEVAAGQNIVDRDAGIIVAYGSISGQVWEDTYIDNTRGEQDARLGGIEVQLVNTMGMTMMTQQTDAVGSYQFSNVLPGSYRIKFIFETQYNLLEANVGDPALDSDVVSPDGFTDMFFLNENENKTNIDAGVFRYANLMGSVYEDVNNNGLQDGVDLLTDLPIAVNLVNDLGEVIATVAPINGVYAFESLLPGQYYILVELLEGYTFTSVNIGTDPSVDFDILPLTTLSGKSKNIFLQSGENETTFDIGYIQDIQFGSVTGKVFEDNYANGIQDGDPGKAGVEVSLFSVSGTQLFTTSSDENGNYIFSSIPEGSYYVELVLPSNYILTDYDLAFNNAIDSDYYLDGNVIRTIDFTIENQDDTFDFDAGMYRLSSITGEVWVDTNNDGLKEDGELRLSDYAVTLRKLAGIDYESTLTDNGRYRFEGLKPGMYHIYVDLEGNYTFADSLVGTNDSVNNDISNFYATYGTTRNLFLLSGEEKSDIDIGLLDNTPQVSTIAGTVFEDLDADGTSVDEPTIAGIIVRLIDVSTGNQVGLAATDADGKYAFNDVELGDYKIVIASTGDWILTSENIGSDESIDSDFEQVAFNAEYTLSINMGGAFYSADAGYYQLADLGDRVWVDANADGLFSIGELGLAGVNLTLFDIVGNVVATQQSSITGFYTFTNLKPGSYRIGTSIPEGYFYTLANVGTDETVDSDIALFVGANGGSDFVMLQSRDAYMDLDIGVQAEEVQTQDAIVSGLVWEDANANGIFEVGEIGTNGVQVSLVDASGTIVQQTTTMPNPNSGLQGVYTFTVSDFGTYTVLFGTGPSPDAVTNPNIGGNFLLDSDVTGTVTNPTTSAFLLESGTVLAGLNYGYYSFGSIGDYVWFDANSDGIQNADESGLNGMMVILFNGSNQVVDQQFTTTNNGQSGYYTFDGLEPGNYIIKLNLQSGFSYTTANAGSDTSIDSDILINTNATDLINLQSNEMNNTLDIGLKSDPASIGDQVWIDLDGDGVQSDGDTGINGVVVELFTEFDELMATTTTSSIGQSMGHYQFDDVLFGNYYVKFTPPAGYVFVRANEGNSDTKDSDVTSSISYGSTDIFTLNSGIDDLDIDAGIFLPSTIGDFTWLDEDRDGIQDASEVGFAGVEIDLYKVPGGLYASTVSGADGKYLFNDLPTGTYFAVFSLSGNFEFTEQLAGNDSTLDSDVSASGMTPLVIVGYNVDYDALDAGVHPSTGLLGQRVWHDINGNGLQDFQEPGIQGVNVTLMADAVVPMRNMETDTLGLYTFSELPEGEYTLHFDAPADYVFTLKNIGFSEDEDSDVDANGDTNMMFVDADNIRRNVDAGMYKMGLLMTEVWNDVNFNGVKDTEDYSLEDVEVELYTVYSELVATSSDFISVGDTKYVNFGAVKPGQYYMMYRMSDDKILTKHKVGNDADRDSDAYTYGNEVMTDIFSLNSGETITNISAGFYTVPQLRKVTANVYPNPTINTVNIAIENADPDKLSEATIRCYDLTGNILFEEVGTIAGSGILTVDITDVKGGIYQLYVYVDGQLFSTKVVKMD